MSISQLLRTGLCWCWAINATGDPEFMKYKSVLNVTGCYLTTQPTQNSELKNQASYVKKIEIKTNLNIRVPVTKLSVKSERTKHNCQTSHGELDRLLLEWMSLWLPWSPNECQAAITSLIAVTVTTVATKSIPGHNSIGLPLMAVTVTTVVT